ncbi:MAG: Fe-S cluster assembly protein SufD [Phycisphaeraceae bacterium]|nr:Fe-S cluster assembly protein SufD [Phycisphaeraceae bacterium]
MTATAIERSRPLIDRMAPASRELGPDWYRPARGAAFDCFAATGLPTVRDEQWRFTRIDPITKTRFELPPPEAPLAADLLERTDIPGLRASRMAFVDGRHRPEATLAEPSTCSVRPLSEAFEAQRALVEPLLAELAEDEDAFTALNGALATEGAVIHVPRGAVVEDPIHLCSVATDHDRAVLSNPRNVIVVEPEAEVTIIEDYYSAGHGVYFNNAVTQIEIGANARVTHYLLVRESDQAFNLSSLHVRQDRDSRFHSHSVLLGGAIARNNIVCTLAGEQCWSQLNGLYVVGGRQQADNYMRVVHAAPHGDSRQYYKGIIDDRAGGVFRGRIVVRPGAQKTDAVQSNQNLLLSEHASANSDPQLEIYADDVKCTHGSTTGQLDASHLFYLKARGISDEVARAMIVFAFASESLERMELAPVRRLFKAQVLERMPAAETLVRML